MCRLGKSQSQIQSEVRTQADMVKQGKAIIINWEKSRTALTTTAELIKREIQ